MVKCLSAFRKTVTIKFVKTVFQQKNVCAVCLHQAFVCANPAIRILKYIGFEFNTQEMDKRPMTKRCFVP